MKQYVMQSLIYTSVIITLISLYTLVLNNAPIPWRIIWVALTFLMIHFSHGVLFYTGALFGLDEYVAIMERGRTEKKKKPRGGAK